jgi:hypothetical protein
VVPFEFSNTPFFFACLMNDIFIHYLDKFFIIFLDDTIIYSKCKEEHENNLRMVL